MLVSSPVAFAAKASVDLEIVVLRGAPIDAAQRWTKQLSANKFNRVRVRTGDESRPSLKTTNSSGTVRHSVIGIIDSRNNLYLPGAKFRLGQKRQIEEWVEKLSADKQTDNQAKRQNESPSSAFGLSEKDLVRLHDRLNIRLDVDAGVKTQDVIRRFEEKTKLKVSVAAVAKVRLTFPVERKISGLSAGTSLAATLRPLRLCMVPQLQGGITTIRIDDLQSARESWPVGWPRQKKRIELVPKLFEHLEVKINSTPLPNVLSAIENKLGVPIIVDDYTFSQRSIELDKLKVNFPSRRVLYDKFMGVILNRNLMRFEVRVDEAGSPFLWVTKI